MKNLNTSPIHVIHWKAKRASPCRGGKIRGASIAGDGFVAADHSWLEMSFKLPSQFLPPLTEEKQGDLHPWDIFATAAN